MYSSCKPSHSMYIYTRLTHDIAHIMDRTEEKGSRFLNRFRWSQVCSVSAVHALPLTARLRIEVRFRCDFAPQQQQQQQQQQQRRRRRFTSVSLLFAVFPRQQA